MASQAETQQSTQHFLVFAVERFTRTVIQSEYSVDKHTDWEYYTAIQKMINAHFHWLIIFVENED